MKKAIFAIMIFMFLLSCENERDECAPADRTGAICKDGSNSKATGSGACSGHGGVERWLCK